MSWLKRAKRWLSHSAPCCKPTFFDKPTTADAIVFVHGLHGHFAKSWKRFPELIYTDPDLPRIDLLLWEYESRVWANVNSISSEANRLMSGLRTHLPRAKNIFLVGHSMGGLAILQGLVNELRDGRARELPVKAVRHVVLFATPTLGSELAAVIKLLAGRVPILRGFVTKQVKDLCPSKFCHTLVGEIANRLYNPRIRPGDENSKRAIPVTACIGTRDEIVSEESARAIFHDLPPTMLDCDHFSIKEPESRDDTRYVAIQNVLAEHYRSWFHSRAAVALKGGKTVPVRHMSSRLV